MEFMNEVVLVVASAMRDKLEQWFDESVVEPEETRVPHLDWFRDRMESPLTKYKDAIIYDWVWIDWNKKYPYVKAFLEFLNQLEEPLANAWCLAVYSGSCPPEISGKYLDHPHMEKMRSHSICVFELLTPESFHAHLCTRPPKPMEV